MKIAEVVDVKEFNRFMSEEFKTAVVTFNGACGKSPELVDDVSIAVDMIFNECKRVIEECDETIQAYKETNRKERLDGIVDIYWTNTQLTNLFEVFAEKFGTELSKEIAHRAYDDQLQIVHARDLVPLAIQLGTGTIITGKAIVASAIRIMKNNEQKYTTDLDKALDWAERLEEGQSMMGYIFKGVKYFCLKRDSDDYIVKPYDFKAVNLEDI